MTMPKGHVHLIVRYGDLHAPREGTVACHRAILDKHGYVWMAKLGRTLGVSRIATIDAQARSGAPTYVFLVKKEAQRYWVTACRVERCVDALTATEALHVPDYYRMTWGVGAWFKVVEMHDLPSAVLQRLIVISSARPASEVLPTSMAGAFAVRIEGEIGVL